MCNITPSSFVIPADLIEESTLIISWHNDLNTEFFNSKKLTIGNFNVMIFSYNEYKALSSNCVLTGSLLIVGRRSNIYEPIIPGILMGVRYPAVIFIPLSAIILTTFKLLPSGGESDILSPGLIV